MQQFVQQLVAGLAEGSIFSSLALALVLIYKATEVINFAQGEMAMFTTYICWALLGHGDTWHWWAFFATLGIAFAFGALIQVTVIRPLQRSSILTVVMATIALLVILNGLATWIWKPELKFFPSPFPFSSWTIGGVHIAKSDVYTLLVVLACVFVLWAFFRFTKLGLAMRAGALNPAAARLLGVRTSVLLALGWGFAAALGAVSGMMIAPNISISAGLQPSMMQSVLVYAFAAAVLGGLESPVGAVVGGLVLGVGLNLLGAYVGFVKPELHLPLALAVLLVVLLVRPAGLLGKVTVRRV
jgi:branched-chain amino acid transport system permease protein